MTTMRNHYQIAITIILLIVLSFWSVFLALQRATEVNFSEKSDKENAMQILKWNSQECNDIIYIGREYGEGTLTVKCRNQKAYLLSSSEHCELFLDVFCWNIGLIDSNTLKHR